MQLENATATGFWLRERNDLMKGKEQFPLWDEFFAFQRFKAK